MNFIICLFKGIMIGLGIAVWLLCIVYSIYLISMGYAFLGFLLLTICFGILIGVFIYAVDM